MSQYSRTFTTTCPGMLLEAINAHSNITAVCEQIINMATGDLIFEFDRSLTAFEETELDSVLGSWSCPPADDGIPADEFSVDDENVGSDTLWSSQKITDMLSGGSLPHVQYNDSDGESSTTSTGYQQKLRLTATTDSSFYMLFWSAEVKCERYTRPMSVRIQVNDSTTVQEVGYDPITFDVYSDFAPASGFVRLSLSAGTTNIDMDYRSLVNGETARIRKARLALMKVTD